MTIVPFAQWAPDQADLNGSVTADVMNVLCAAQSYIPFPSASVLTEALEDDPLAAILARGTDGQIHIFAATAEKLWRLNANSLDWDDVSQENVTYGASKLEPWCLAQFGDYVVAVNANDDPQVFQLTSSDEFSDLPGGPPRARVARVWGGFLALMGLTSNPERVHWSGLENIEHWTPGEQNSDYQDFPDGGMVMGSTQATNPIIFQQRAIQFGTFVPGSLLVFTFAKIHDMRGAKSALSIATRGSFAFYADEGGFFQISQDGSVANIGFEKVDKTVYGDISATDISAIRGVVDPVHSRVYWAVNINSSEHYNRLIIYDWNLQKWSQASVDIHLHVEAATLGYTLEGLDAISDSIDDLPFSLDSRVWQGGAPVLAAFNLDNRLAFFSGPALQATVTTQEMGDTAGGVTRVNYIMPVVDTDQVTIAIGSRMRRSEPRVWSQARAPSANTGIVRGKSRSRFHRFRMNIPAGVDWSHAQGVDVDSERAGNR